MTLKIFYLLLILWPIGFCIGILCKKTALKLCNKREGIFSPDEISADKNAIASTYRHFRVSFIIYMVTIAIGVFQPIKEFKWLAFWASGMIFIPVFYDVFYVNIHVFTKSKVRFINTIPSVINLALEVFTLLCYYFAYIQMKNLR
jgi:uncharacterized membrane protein